MDLSKNWESFAEYQNKGKVSFDIQTLYPDSIFREWSRFYWQCKFSKGLGFPCRPSFKTKVEPF